MTKKEIATRALKTFIQAFISTLLTEITALATQVGNFDDIDLSWKIALPIVIPAIAAATSALWNYLIAVSESNERQKKEAASEEKMIEAEATENND